MRGYLLTPARHPRCTTIYWFDQPKRQNESLPSSRHPCALFDFRYIFEGFYFYLETGRSRMMSRGPAQARAAQVFRRAEATAGAHAP